MASRSDRVTGAAVAPLIAAAVFLVLGPLTLRMPSDGLDPSWALVLERATLNDWQWGRDIVFTFGPYGYLYQRLFHPDLTVQILAGATALALLLGLGIALAVRGAGFWTSAAAVAAALVSLPMIGDSAYFLLPFLAVLLHFRRPTAPRWYLLAAAVYCGLAVLIKTTFAVLALFLLLVVDVDRMLKRRPPFLVPVALLAALAFYIAAGQSLSSMPAFISLSLEVAAGFNRAMTVFDSLRAVELGAFLAASLTVLTLAAIGERKSGLLGTWSGALLLVAASAYWFVTYKAGFTRQDLHTLISWTCLGTGAALFAATAGPAFPTRIRQLLLIGGLAIALLAPARMIVQPGVGAPALVHQTLVGTPLQTLRQAAAILANPSGWMAEQQGRRAEAMAAIRARNPLPPGDGTIDTIPSIQAAVIAAGYDGGAAYCPRPVFQEYSTYTAALIAANLAFVDGHDAPDTVLLAPGSIDNRYPSLAEGPLWPTLLRRYAAAELAGPVRHLNKGIDVLILQRRGEDAVVTLGREQSLSVGLGTWLAVPDLDAPLMARVDLSLSWAGRVLSLLHQTPAVEMSVTLADGSAHGHRLIPDIARQGFVLSPYLPHASAARRLFDGEPWPDNRVVALRIDVPATLRWAFTDPVAISLRALR